MANGELQIIHRYPIHGFFCHLLFVSPSILIAGTTMLFCFKNVHNIYNNEGVFFLFHSAHSVISLIIFPFLLFSEPLLALIKQTMKTMKT